MGHNQNYCYPLSVVLIIHLIILSVNLESTDDDLIQVQPNSHTVINSNISASSQNLCHLNAETELKKQELFFGNFFLSFYRAYGPIHGYVGIVVCVIGIIVNIITVVILSR